MGRELSRRSLLAGTAGVALLPLVACSSDPEPPPPPDPDDLLRSAAVQREQALLQQYDAVLAAHPDLTARLLAVRGQHAEHLLALTGPPPTGSPSPEASPTAVGTPPAAVPPAVDAATALAGLVAAEQAAAAGHGEAVPAASRELAGLLASLSASEASHPVDLA